MTLRRRRNAIPLLCCVLFVVATLVAQTASPSSALAKIQLRAPSSKIAAQATELPVNSARLMFDSVDYFSKAHGSPTRAHEIMTTMYLVLSNREIGCEMNDIFNASDFIRHNKPRLEPRIPADHSGSDWTLVVSHQLADPSRKSVPIVPLVTGQSSGSVSFPFVDATLYDSAGKHEISDSSRKPIVGRLTVSHNPDGQDAAELAIDRKNLTISGKVPIQMCKPNYFEVR
jgi:hypothetical protein